MMDLRVDDALVDFMHHLADVSATAIAPHFRRNLTVEEKHSPRGFDPVTAADRAAEAIIREEIRKSFPEHSILGEELGETKGLLDDAATSSSSARYRWVIDPIDGTRAFILGLPTWGTLIGLEINEQPAIGMMNQPFTGDRFWCDGISAYLRTRNQPTVTLQARRQVVELADAQAAATHPDIFAAGEETAAFRRLATQTKAVRYGTDCFAYAMLAAGLIDIVAEADLKPYDIVALIPIIEQSGGIVTTWDGAPARSGGRILATANEQLHEKAMSTLAIPTN